jgi:hypothetical protein
MIHYFIVFVCMSFLLQDVKEVKSKRQKKCRGDMKQEEKRPKAVKKVPEEPPTGYVHVRARRGQATDSHSLAERVLCSTPTKLTDSNFD